MTTETRRLAHDERAATDNSTIPPSSIPQTDSTRTTSTPHSPLRRNHDAQTSLPAKTSKTKKRNLEIYVPHLNTLDNIIKQYSPPVYETYQAPRHTQRATTKCPNHHKQTTHARNRKRPRVALNPTLASETTEDITSPDTQQPTYIIETPYEIGRAHV